ncbi:DUF1194 domain-containing protein [Nisaea acidiphila]|uniref:DUF1194 domain-containing protein n=1 Tax=Nisaea acidiphila TaxID=1862145 RepID=A0A9J7ATZ1_9PROT|nr:DUF1194 domain-containing protein [Nisaea acidiphila]UUX50574.1 DUF1194 domain-containing protein [Nisaea acidiphila]
MPFSALIGGWRKAALGALSAVALSSTASLAQSPLQLVDLKLMLAVDVSGSVDFWEADLQRDGYVQALRDPTVINTMLSGQTGRIALSYIEWAGGDHQRVVVGWTVIDSPAAALDFAETLDVKPHMGGRRTSIGNMLDFAVKYFRDSRFFAERQVIDISGDGPNNSGTRVDDARDRAIASGLVINALPILNERPSPYGFPKLDDLDIYYEECVVGGDGAFVIAAKGIKSFAAAVRRKMILEVAGRTPDRAVRRVPAAASGGGGYNCDIGEQQLHEFLNRGDD